MPYEQLNLSTTKPVLSWANHELDQKEAQMASNVVSLPFVFKHVALMPDVHLGKGALVGSVIATKDAVIPAAVGVDIGCGMAAVKISKSVTNWQGWSNFKELHPGVKDLDNKALQQMGSLGGGNHFIELCLDTENNVWLMLHSGSRHIGNKLAQCHISTGKKLAKLADSKLPDPDLAYFVAGTPEFASYWRDLQWAQDYARFNRDEMMARFKKIVEEFVTGGKVTKPLLSVNCHHNYAEKEVHFGEEVYVTRKGAVRAQQSDYGIIPGSMGTKSYIVKGKGNHDSYCSCSHGAGRLMSRTKAKKQFTVEDLIEQTQGVECRKDSKIIDEIPGAYKPIEQVMAQQADLVEIVATLKQVVCVKG